MPLKRIERTSDMRGSKHKNTRRENRLEELGRVDAEKAYTSKGKRNLRQEKSRIRKELSTGGLGSPDPKRSRTLKDKLTSARIEARIESAKDKINPLKGDRVAGRGEKKSFFPTWQRSNIIRQRYNWNTLETI